MNRFFYTMMMTMLSPFGILGTLAYIIQVIRTRNTVSTTAYEALNWRLIYHMDGSRDDPAALQLARGLPGTNILFRNLTLRTTVLLSRISGYVPTYVAYPAPDPTPLNALIAARCVFYDKAIGDHISPGGQVVILGAGWDTRAYGWLRDKKVTIFEVDRPNTQAAKLAAIDKVGILDDVGDVGRKQLLPCNLDGKGLLKAKNDVEKVNALGTQVALQGGRHHYLIIVHAQRVAQYVSDLLEDFVLIWSHSV